ENGKPIEKTNFKGNVAFILGDHEGLTKEDEKFLDGIAEKVSVGKRIYLTSHVIAYVNIFLDKLL
ncbi:tRNA (pseudouridine(54)-N(1))-methyltransferase TrmY, partial [Thermococci archaeon]